MCVIILLLLVGVVSGCGLGTVWMVNTCYDIWLIGEFLKMATVLMILLLLLLLLLLLMGGVPYRRVVC